MDGHHGGDIFYALLDEALTTRGRTLAVTLSGTVVGSQYGGTRSGGRGRGR